MMNLYKVILEDTDNVYRVFVPAESVKAAVRYVQGNGYVVATQDVTDDYPLSLDCVHKALVDACFGQTEIDLILRMLQTYSNAI